MQTDSAVCLFVTVNWGKKSLIKKDFVKLKKLNKVCLGFVDFHSEFPSVFREELRCGIL